MRTNYQTRYSPHSGSFAQIDEGQVIAVSYADSATVIGVYLGVQEGYAGYPVAVVHSFARQEPIEVDVDLINELTAFSGVVL